MRESERFVKMRTPEAEDQLRAIFGQVDFERYFETRVLVNLDPGRLTDAQADRVLWALGDAAGEVLEMDGVITRTPSSVSGPRSPRNSL